MGSVGGQGVEEQGVEDHHEPGEVQVASERGDRMTQMPTGEEDPEDGARRLIFEVATLVVNRNLDKDIDAQVVARLMTPGVAYLYDCGDQALSQLLTLLRGIRGLPKQVDAVRKYFDQTMKRTRARASDLSDTGGPIVRDVVEAPNEWPAYPTPAGWVASPAGISKQVAEKGELRTVLVADEPLLVTAVRKDVGTGRESLVLGYRRHNRWVELAMPREHARSGRDLVAYCGQGLPVSAGTSRDIEAWLVGCERAGRQEIPVREVTSRTGWHGDLYVQGPGGPLELEDPDEVRTGWRTSGTWGGWLDALSVIEAEPAAWLVLYSAAVAPLLRWLQLGHCPIVDLSGPKGRGKTTCLRLAGSAWGRPDDGIGGTILTWGATPTYLERLAARTWDAPLLLDDTKRARRPQDVTQALYALAQGRGQGRGMIVGVQRTATWRTVAISTGEAPLVEATEAGGAKARVLSITISPAISSMKMAKALEARILVNHGHLGPRLAARALELGPELHTRYQAALNSWAIRVPADTRLLSTCAAIDVAHGVCLEIGMPEPQADWRAALRTALEESVTAGDQATRALDLVRDELARHGSAYRGHTRKDRTGEEIEPSGGYRGIWREGDAWIGIYPGVLLELLRAAEHDATVVIGQWMERGILSATRGRNQLEVGLRAGEKHRVYAFLKSRVLE